MMKIAFVIGSLRSGGAERVVSVLANYMAKQRGLEIFIVTITNHPVFYKLDTRVKLICLNFEERKDNGIINSLKFNFLSVKALNSVFLKNNIKVVCSFLTETNIKVLLASKIVQGTNVIISERNSPFHDPLPKIWKSIRKILYRWTDYLVVQNLDQAAFYGKMLSKDKIRTISNPVIEYSTFESNRISFVSIGRMDDNKNQIDLIKSFISAKLPCELLLIGDGPNKMKLEVLAKGNSNIRFLGKIDNVYQFLSKESIFVSTSLSEGFPNALIEAMSMGLAPIHYDCPSGIDEIIIHEQNGILIQVGDLKSLREGMIELHNNKDLRLKLAKNAQEVIQKYSISEIANQWLTIFKIT